MVRQRDPRPDRRAAIHARRRRKRAGETQKSAFLSLLSHELKTPLNTILGQAELLLNDTLPQPAREAAAAIRDAGEGLYALIGDLLEIARPDGAPRSEAELDARALGESLRRLALPVARARALDLEVAVDPAVPPRLMGDAARIRQTLTKLVDNALKFTERGGVTVSIGMTGDGSMLRFAVADTGAGIDPADQDRIFNPFEQTEGLLTRRHSGLGLGLPLAAQMVRAMGGRIGVESRPAAGATFWFTVPVARPADAGTADAQPAEDERIEPRLAARLKGLNVLAADDNPLYRAMLARIFDSCGIVGEIAADGLEAAEIAGKRIFDIVLLDAHMPVAGGLQAARMIRTLTQRQKTPYLVLACAPGDPSEAEAALVGDAVLRKPYGGRSLAAAFAVALDGARTTIDDLDTAAIADLEQSVGRGVLVDILRSYMSAAETMTARIEAALPDDDALALEQAARDLASAAGGLGLAALTAAAQDLSQAAREGRVTRALTLKAEKLVALSGSTHTQLTALYPDLTDAA